MQVKVLVVRTVNLRYSKPQMLSSEHTEQSLPSHLSEPDTTKPREACAVFAGINWNGEDIATQIYFALLNLQHRGQDSSGIVTAAQGGLLSHRGMGLIFKVYDQANLDRLIGSVGIGHNRYATSGSSSERYLQPLYDSELQLAFAFNGNIPDLEKMKAFLEGLHISCEGMNDADMMFAILKYFLKITGSIVTAVEQAYQWWNGAFSAVILHQDRVLGVRGPYGIRPLVLGNLPNGLAIASESSAFATIEGSYIRDVKPGELVELSPDSAEVISYQIGEKSAVKFDAFELIYFMHPASIFNGENVASIRYRMGAQLARELRHILPELGIDLVIPVPQSGVPAAEGCAAEGGIPYSNGIIKNNYIARTFIGRTKEERELALDHKHIVLKDSVHGKTVLIIDDSIVRGPTARRIVAKCRAAGATKVYFAAASPEGKYPGFYGINTPTQDELISARMCPAEIAQEIGADDVFFLSLDGLVKAIGLPKEKLDLSAFTGEYPLEIGANNRTGIRQIR